MTTLLLDASVLLAAFDPEDDHHEPARGLLENDEATLATLDLARYEVANVARRGGVLVSTDTLLARAAEIAERHAISAYAAAADEGGHRLVSCDERDLVSKGLAALPVSTQSQLGEALRSGESMRL